MSEEKLNVSVKIDGQFCLRKFKKIKAKLIEKPYRDKRYKKGFRMELFNPETGQFIQGRYVTYWKNKKND